ncbi:MAG: M20 peptidase aminoacylase family protein [Bacilli bacterium]
MKALLDDLQPTIFGIFNHLHDHPEISWQETKTTEYIENILLAHQCRVTSFSDCTGIVGEIGEGSPIIGVRADLDALWQNVNGEFRANHSCGHDAHMTIVLGVMLLLTKIDRPKGTIRFIFQPAEEKGTGALKIIEKGIVDDIDFLYGVHLRPFQEVANGQATPAILHGAARFISGEIVGDDTHGARPHLGINAIEVGADLVHRLNAIHLNPMVPFSVKMTKLIAGGENLNIIPGSASFGIDLRAQTNKAIEELTEKVIKAIQTLSHYYSIEIKQTLGANVAAAEVNPEAVAIMTKAIESVLGEENVLQPTPTSGGEDFHFYTLERPHIKATMLGLGCDLKPGLHHPQMTFDHLSLLKGIEILSSAVIHTLHLHGGSRN